MPDGRAQGPAMVVSMTFGELLKRHRLAAGLTQEALAERAALSARAVSDLERGVNHAPRRDTVELLTAALALSGRRRDAFVSAARPGSASASAGGRTDLATLAPLTSFVGRAQELTAVVALLLRPDVRLVTLTGPGGVGKTRLALQVVQAVAGQLEEGVDTVFLGSLADPALVLSAVAQALGAQEVSGRTLEAILADTLSGGPRLLLLDNFERVLAAGPEIASLLRRCPRLKVLVTSRAPLRVSGEREYPVPPLPVPPAPDAQRPLPVEDLLRFDALRLFCERAQARRPDFGLTPRDAPAVISVCARLDGLPLAIELAASSITVLSPQAIAARLERRLPLLPTGDRDLPARQQTLRASLDWSHDLLSAAEQSLFRGLAVFAGGCTLEAAEAVCAPSLPDGRGTARPAEAPEGGAPGHDVVDLLASLVDQNLVRQEARADGEPRFAMLETVRDYALERLEASGQAGAIRRRHASYYLALAEEAEPELRGQRQAEWLGRLTLEQDNLRAAMRDAVALGGAEIETALRLGGALWWFWYLRGLQREGGAWLATILNLLSPSGHGPGADDFSEGGALPAGAPGSARAGLHHSPSRQMQAARAKVLTGAGVLAHQRGVHGDARSLSEQGLAIWREVGDWRWAAAALTTLGIVARDIGDLATARARSEESLSLRRDVGDRWGMALELNNLALVASMQGDLAGARALVEESLTIKQEVGDHGGIAFSLASLGVLAVMEGDGPAARVHLELGLAAWQETDSRASLPLLLECFALLATAEGRPDRALRLAAAGAALHDTIGASSPPFWQEQLERSLTMARQALGSEAAVAWSEGRALAPDEAVVLALLRDDPA